MVEGLPAEYGLDLDVGEGVFELLGGGLSLGFLYVAAPVEGHDMTIAGVGGDNSAMGHFMDMLAYDRKDAVEEADYLSSDNGPAVHDGVAMCGGDFDGMNVLDGVFHGLQDLVAGEFRDVGEQGGDALSLAAGGDDVEGFADDFGSLAGGEDDVGVVREDDHVFRAGGASGFQQFLGAGVHGALAGNDGVAAEIIEEADEAVTPGYGDNSEVRSCLLLAVEGEEALVLLVDVIYLDADGVAKGGSVGNNLIGLKRVKVDLGEGRVANDDEGGAPLREVAAEGGDVYVFAFYHELGAEAVLLRLGGGEEFLAYGGHVGDGGGRGGEFNVIIFRVLFEERAEEAFHNDDDALTAGIDYAGVTEDREHGGGLGEGVPGFFEGAVPEVQDIFLIVGAIGRAFGETAQDGEHGAFDRLGDSLVAGLGAGGEGAGEGVWVGNFNVFEALGESGEELREDDAAVSTSAEECAASRFMGDGGEGGGVDGLQAVIHGLHGEEHVGASVAIRDGEDVECVDDMAISLKAAGGCAQGGFEPVTVDFGQGAVGGARNVNPCKGRFMYAKVLGRF